MKDSEEYRALQDEVEKVQSELRGEIEGLKEKNKELEEKKEISETEREELEKKLHEDAENASSTHEQIKKLQKVRCSFRDFVLKIHSF